MPTLTAIRSARLSPSRAISISTSLRSAFAAALCTTALIAPSTANAACAHWTATSRTSTSITGNIVTCPGTLTFGNGKKLKLKFAGNKKGSWAFGSADTAMIYRVTPPSDPLLLNGNTLCGKPVHYIALSPGRDGKLGMTVFGTDLSDLCAIYFYEPH